jgi:REP element-mobilizing transposase RayT
MARKLRIEYPGAVYHVMSRGDRRGAIFRDDQDYQGFLQTLGEACAKAKWQVHAWCLLPGCFHLVIETPQPTLVAGMKWFLGTYTGRFNRRHQQFGHLFSGRYQALPVDDRQAAWLKMVCDYVHLSPVRAKRIKPRQRLEQFPWSSYSLYLAPPRQRPAWLRVDRLLGEWRIPQDTAAGRRAFATGLEQRRKENLGEAARPIERGWFLGDEEFRQKLLAKVAAMPGAAPQGGMAREMAEMQAERLVKDRLKALGWREQDLTARRKGDPAKVKLAAAVRAGTTMTLAWIAGRLAMGSRGYLTWLLYRHDHPS